MTEQKEKKQNNQTSGYFLIALGVIGIVLRFIGGNVWTTVGIIKFVISIAVIGVGLWTILKKKP